jgi:hypothetical protein
MLRVFFIFLGSSQIFGVNFPLNYFMPFYFRLCPCGCPTQENKKYATFIIKLTVQVGAENFLPLLFQKYVKSEIRLS